MADDGAAFIGFPTAGQTVPQALTTLGLLNSSMATAIAQSTLFPTPDANNATLDVFNVSARVSTDVQLRCLDQATVVAAVANDVFPAVFAYQFDRSYQACLVFTTQSAVLIRDVLLFRRQASAPTSQFAKRL